MGAASSHLGMATGAPASERSIEGFVLPGPGHQPGVDDSALAWSHGDSSSVLAGADNDEFAAEVSANYANEPHGGRQGVPSDLSGGARLTVSPSMKTPWEAPVPPYHSGRVVQSSRGRSNSTFAQGASEVYGG